MHVFSEREEQEESKSMNQSSLSLFSLSFSLSTSRGEKRSSFSVATFTLISGTGSSGSRKVRFGSSFSLFYLKAECPEAVASLGDACKHYISLIRFYQPTNSTRRREKRLLATNLHELGDLCLKQSCPKIIYDRMDRCMDPK